MPEVLIIIDQPQTDVMHQMVLALKRAIVAEPAVPLLRSHGAVAKPGYAIQPCPPTIQVVTLADVAEPGKLDRHVWLCPLTVDLPAWLPFPGADIFQTCRDVQSLQRQMEQWGVLTGRGDFWLPIVWTAKGPLYGAVIGFNPESAAGFDRSWEQLYVQPVHQSDQDRQRLYQMGYRLLRSLAAPPAAYLMQFGMRADIPCFDRLLPFPAAPAIASLNRQIPNLFDCHWCCLTGKPIYDLTIAASGVAESGDEKCAG